MRPYAVRDIPRRSTGTTYASVVPGGSAYLSLNIVYGMKDAQRSRNDGKGWNAALLRDEFEEAIRRADAGDPWLSEHNSTIEWAKDVPLEAISSFREDHRPAMARK